MSRWEFLRPEQTRVVDDTLPPAKRREELSDGTASVGRGPTDGTSTSTPEKPERSGNLSDSRLTNRRTRHRDRDHSYSLRSSEIAAMTDIGRFRIIDVRDLIRFVYSGDEARLKHDLASLRRQGLVEEKTVFRAHKSARKLVTLTAEGERLVRKASGLPSEQRLYHGFVKPKELDHDADLFKVYQNAAKAIREKGGTLTRVRLDFELKESINRTREAAARIPDDDRKRLLAAAALEQGLQIDGTTIHLPDIQIEYQTRDGQIERENLELLSRNYREDGIRGKAASGFKIYARSADSSRIRRALHDTGMVREVLSV